MLELTNLTELAFLKDSINIEKERDYLMKNLFINPVKFLIILGLSFTIEAKSEFCRGFEEGYRMVKGDMVIVPICPIPPITPIGSTPYREGLKAGIERAENS